jgi:hypothetical protein
MGVSLGRPYRSGLRFSAIKLVLRKAFSSPLFISLPHILSKMPPLSDSGVESGARAQSMRRARQDAVSFKEEGYKERYD